MKHKKVELVKTEKPLLLVVDPSLVFPQILNATLRRAGCEVEIIAFQKTEMAFFWLSGEMDREKAGGKYPFTSPWDAYPALRHPKLAIISLGFPIDERERIMDWFYVRSRATKIITTSAEELPDQDDCRDELYWRHVVSHLPRPVTVKEVVERVVTVLSS